MPAASVIIPVYNGDKFIDRAIHSALNQSFDDVEIIVIDDASTDHTRENIFDHFSHLIGQRVLYFRNEQNMERAFSRNKGAELSRSDYIFFLDYDDEWHANYLENVLDVFSTGNFEIVYSFQRTFIDEESKLKRVSRKKMDHDVGAIIFSSLIGYPTASAFQKSSFPRYDGKYIPREDWEIYLRAYLSHMRITVLDNDRIKIRSHGGRTSSGAVFWSSTLRVHEDYRDRVPFTYESDFLFHIGDTCLRYGDTIRGLRLSVKAITKNPGILSDLRNALSLAKRGIRIDKYLRLYGARKGLFPGG